MDLLLIIVVLWLVFGGGTGYYFNRSQPTWGPARSYGSGLGIIIVLLVLFYFFGGFHHFGYR